MNHSEAKTAHMALVREAIASAPLSTLGECAQFLAWCISRIEQFDRDQPALDMNSVIDQLADAEHELSVVALPDPETLAQERAALWRAEERRERCCE